MIWLASHYRNLEQQDLVVIFHEFIFPHPSPIILLLFSCHLLCLDFSFFFTLITYLPLSMLRLVGILLVLYTLLKCIRFGVQAAVDNTIEETNATSIFDFAGKSLCHSTTIRVCCLSKKKCSPPIILISINMV